jgi:hypothetical protein
VPLLRRCSRLALLARLALAALLAPATACAQPAPARTAEPPLKLAPRPTTAAITDADLMTRLYIFADDSMLGREAGTEGSVRGTAYIARQLALIGARPAGDSGTYFQTVPFLRRIVSPRSAVSVDGTPLALWTDVVPTGGSRSLDGAEVVFGGVQGEPLAITAAQAAGKVVLLGGLASGYALPAVGPGSPLHDAAGVALVVSDETLARTAGAQRRPRVVPPRKPGPAPLVVQVSARAARLMLGRSPDGAVVGTAGRRLTGTLFYEMEPAPARNVVAVIPGTDPALRGSYVALGAHSDHVGVASAAVDHDSLKAFNREVWRLRGAYAGLPELSPEQRAAIRVNVDSLRRLRPARRDSVYNGADDDGSGSMALLEIAEALAKGPKRPKRSVLFVWHTGEEKGLLGSLYFTDNPTVPRDSIVAQINIDMIGRGQAQDTQGGGPGYVGVVGARRLSTELGALLDSVNRGRREALSFDYRLDADGHPENIYCRSDHYEYARFGIPVAFFFTGLHGDYHQVTDEPQYIDYANYGRITRFIYDLTLRVADLGHRPAVDGPRMEPGMPCRQ